MSPDRPPAGSSPSSSSRSAASHPSWSTMRCSPSTSSACACRVASHVPRSPLGNPFEPSPGVLSPPADSAVTLKRSGAGRLPAQRATLKGLGLSRDLCAAVDVGKSSSTCYPFPHPEFDSDPHTWWLNRRTRTSAGLHERVRWRHS